MLTGPEQTDEESGGVLEGVRMSWGAMIKSSLEMRSTLTFAREKRIVTPVKDIRLTISLGSSETRGCIRRHTFEHSCTEELSGWF